VNRSENTPNNPFSSPGTVRKKEREQGREEQEKEATNITKTNESSEKKEPRALLQQT
jgi:hypothetical protein